MENSEAPKEFSTTMTGGPWPPWTSHNSGLPMVTVNMLMHQFITYIILLLSIRPNLTLTQVYEILKIKQEKIINENINLYFKNKSHNYFFVDDKSTHKKKSKFIYGSPLLRREAVSCEHILLLYIIYVYVRVQYIHNIMFLLIFYRHAVTEILNFIMVKSKIMIC